MVAKTLINLDKKDKRILYELDLNSRVSYAKLAKKLKTSKQFIRYRMERLEKLKIIKYYYTYIDYMKLGYTFFRVQIKLKNATEQKKKELLDFVSKLDQTMGYRYIGSRWDLTIGFVVKDMNEFYSTWEKILETQYNIIDNYLLGFYIDYNLYSKSYLINKENKSIIKLFRKDGIVKHDDVDIKILDSILKNSRKSLLEISKEVGISTKAVQNKIKRLEKEQVIAGYNIFIDLELLGLHFFKVEVKLKDYNKVEELLRYCYKHKNITYCQKILNPNSIEIAMHISSAIELQHVISDMMEKTKAIESYEYHPVLSENLIKK
tara:strand:+ start:42 stop:1001 length:960 start_codon:yes stop_codon:yes gene_type:complete